MAKYRIVCTTQLPFSQPHHHAHIVRVGTGQMQGKPENLWTVREVYSAMNAGDGFYTHGDSSGQSASVEKCICRHCRTYETLRSVADHVKDNNLDSLPKC